MYAIEWMSAVKVGQSRAFWYRYHGGRRTVGLCKAAEFSTNSKPYEYEYDRMTMFNEHFNANGDPDLTTQLRSAMMAHTPTAQFVFRDTTGWKAEDGWTDDYEEFATLLRRFEKAGLYNGLLPERPGLTGAQWKASREGCDWMFEAQRFRKERWNVLAAAQTQRGLTAAHDQRKHANRLEQKKQKTYQKNFFKGHDLVTRDSKRQRARDRERERAREGDRQRAEEGESEDNVDSEGEEIELVVTGCSYPDRVEFEKRCSSNSTWIDAFYGSDWYKAFMVFFVKLSDVVSPVWLQTWQVHHIMRSEIWAIKWMDLASKKRPRKMRDRKNGWQILAGGATLRTSLQDSTFADFDVARVGAIVRFQSYTRLCCLTNSYLNDAYELLSETQRHDIRDTVRSVEEFSQSARRKNWPVRLSRRQFVTTLPSDKGSYLVGRVGSHADLVKITSDGSIRFFSSDPNVSRFVLSGDSKFVRQNLLNQDEAYQIIKLVRPDMSQFSSAERVEKNRIRKRRKRAKARQVRRSKAVRLGL
jgi:hypothetical protein